MDVKTKAVSSGGSTVASGVWFLDFEKSLARIQHDIEQMELEQRESGRDLAADVEQQRRRLRATTKNLYGSLTPWELVQVARHPKRPLTPDYMSLVFRDVCELHGDRTFGDDRAIITAFARIGGHKVMLIGHNKGRELKERIACNFGCAHPEGYRKALAKMRLAEKFSLPVVCLIDTQGAYPGIGAEERGIASAIAVNLFEMSRLRTPIVGAVIGEGGSGGALGIGVCDRMAMFEHSFYSVISPEGCAAILWKTGERARHAAEALKLTAKELKRLKLVDQIVAEPVGGAHRDPAAAAASLEKYICDALTGLKRLKIETVLRRRYDRIRALGCFFSAPEEELAATKKPVRTPRRAISRASRIGARARSSAVGNAIPASCG